MVELAIKSCAEVNYQGWECNLSLIEVPLREDIDSDGKADKQPFSLSQEVLIQHAGRALRADQQLEACEEEKKTFCVSLDAKYAFQKSVLSEITKAGLPAHNQDLSAYQNKPILIALTDLPGSAFGQAKIGPIGDQQVMVLRAQVHDDSDPLKSYFREIEGTRDGYGRAEYAVDKRMLSATMGQVLKWVDMITADPKHTDSVSATIYQMFRNRVASTTVDLRRVSRPLSLPTDLKGKCNDGYLTLGALGDKELELYQGKVGKRALHLYSNGSAGASKLSGIDPSYCIVDDPLVINTLIDALVDLKAQYRGPAAEDVAIQVSRLTADLNSALTRVGQNQMFAQADEWVTLKQFGSYVVGMLTLAFILNPKGVIDSVGDSAWYTRRGAGNVARGARDLASRVAEYIRNFRGPRGGAPTNSSGRDLILLGRAADEDDEGSLRVSGIGNLSVNITGFITLAGITYALVTLGGAALAVKTAPIAIPLGLILMMSASSDSSS